jgi:ribosomal protein S18 acetylase RimI-like enzyme
VTGVAVEIRRVRNDDWRVLRGVRLAALADAPDAFGSTHAQALERPDAWWIEWCARSADSDTQAMVLAWDGATPLGMAGAYLDDDGGWNVISMWVDPAARGRGVGRVLLDQVVAFAREHGADEVVLGVSDGNEAARTLYETYGFADNGDSEPLASNPALNVRYLTLRL